MSFFAYSLKQIDEIFERANNLGQLRSIWFRYAGESNIEEYGILYKELAIKAREIRRALRQLLNPKKYEEENEDKIEELKEKLESNKQERSYIEKTIKDNIQKGICNNSFRLNIEKVYNVDMGKDMYVTGDDRDSFFACKIIADEMQKSFKIPQPNRIQILRSLQLLLVEPIDKILVRCDIKQFFESIPRNELVAKLESTGLLNNRTLRLIRRMFGDLTNKFSCVEGVPRGISFSPMMADFYLREIDKTISSLSGVYFYKRYVDDIIVVASPSTNFRNAIELYKKLVEIFGKSHLQLHPADSDKYIAEDLHYGVEGKLTFDYLGYQISLNKKTAGITMLLTNNRIARYKEQIDKAVSFYERKANCKPVVKGKRLGHHHQPLYKLHKTLSFLTCNYHLGGTKSGILSGIYFKHELLTDTGQLSELDEYLDGAINRISPALFHNIKDKNGVIVDDYWEKIRLTLHDKYSFVRGFEKRKMCKMTSNDFKMIKHLFNYETEKD